MKKILFFVLATISFPSIAQENVYPAPKQNKAVLLKNAIVHIGNGKVLNNMQILMQQGIIVAIDKLVVAPADANSIDCSGKHIYPGLIAPISALGLIELGAVKASRDAYEFGDYNPNMRSIVAYNTDSKVINTVRSNGILLAQVVPQGGIISGSSSVVQLDAWNWEDAAYKTDIGIHIHIPNLVYRKPWWDDNAKDEDPEFIKRATEKITGLKSFFSQAKAYHTKAKKDVINIKFESVKKLFTKEQKLFAHANTVKEILIAINIANEVGCELVIVGGIESYKITDVLKQYNVGVILNQPHSLPSRTDEAIDQPFTTASKLQQEGIVFSIFVGDEDGFWQVRNLPFQAGTLAAYGLTKEEALQSITLNAAKILGMADRTGSIEIGKDANIIISEGDILDMKSSKVTDAYIQGRAINLDNKQTQLFEKYKYKYNIK
jgi:imidazolonepropionase-like amidohydrolase